MQNRRVFLGSAAVAGVGAAVGVMMLPAPHTYAQTGVADPVLGELRKQLEDTVAAVRRGRGRPGEHARRLASVIRLLNAHGVGAAADTVLRRRLDAEGRDALLAREFDMVRFMEELKALGIDRVPTLIATYPDRVRMFDQTVRNGMTATLASLSASFDRIAVALDQSVATPVAARQSQEEECFQWLIAITGIEALMWEWCIVEFSLCVMMMQIYIVYANFACALGCFCAI